MCANCRTELEGNIAISDIHWYPHDTGMITVALGNGRLMAWDLSSLTTVDVLDVRQSLSCHELGPNGKLVAFGTPNGLELYDFSNGTKIVTMRSTRPRSYSPYYSSTGVTALTWDCHRSDLILSGTIDGQLSQWDLRYPKEPLFIAPPMVPRPARIKKILNLPGLEGNLPAVAVHCEGKVFKWSMMGGGYEQWSAPDKTINSVDIVSLLDLPVYAAENELIIGNVSTEIPGIQSALVNPFTAEVYAYEQNHERLYCYRAD